MMMMDMMVLSAWSSISGSCAWRASRCTSHLNVEVHGMRSSNTTVRRLLHMQAVANSIVNSAKKNNFTTIEPRQKVHNVHVAPKQSCEKD